MKKIKILIDKLTNSIINKITSDVFDTEISAVSTKDLKNISKKNKWLFNWKKAKNYYQVYKLYIVGNSEIIQGLVALEEKYDHIYLHLIENAPFNLGKDKVYEGVAGNLFAYACKVSFEKGFSGYISFQAKTALIKHYQDTLGAKRLGKSSIMVIETKEAQILVNRYFKT